MDLTVIILSYNTKEITDKCLTKLELAKTFCEKKLKNKVEIVVLDNASSDGSLQMIKDHPVKLIAQKENLGFGRGNNLAIKQSKNPYILLLNSDVYLEEDSLYKALAYFRVNLNCDVLGVRLNYSTGTLQPSCGNLPNPLNVITWILGLGIFPLVNGFISPFHPNTKRYFAKAHQVGWVMGAFFMFKRKVFEKTSGFDEKIFMHMEEVEWCKQITDANFKIWYMPFIEVVHLHGASTNFDLSLSFLNELKGIKYYLQKHYNFSYWPIKLFLIIGLILRIIAFAFFRKTKRARVYMEGLKVV